MLNNVEYTQKGVGEMHTVDIYYVSCQSENQYRKLIL